MTIKQQGGIFGRNPTFNDVEVSKLDVDNINIDGNTISSTNTNGNVTVDPDGTGYLDVQLPATAGVAEGLRITNPQNAGTFGDGASIRFQNTPDPGQDRHARIECFSRGAYGQSTSFRFLINNGTAAPRNVFQMLGDNGNVYVTEGNLLLSGGGNVVMNSGSGIDFSATSDGSGSTNSELFDDYEEGTFTPTYTTSGTDFDSVSYSVRYGNYVKIGSLIFVTGFIRTSSITVGSASGSVKIGGLPFARSGSMSPPGICQGGSWSGDVPRSCISFTDSTLGLYYRTGGNTADQAVQVADLDASGNNDLYFSCSFRESY